MIDYKELLHKYIKWVIEREGISFVSHISFWENNFSEEEINLLTQIAKEEGDINLD